MASTKTLNVFLIEAVIAAQGDATTALGSAGTALTNANTAITDAGNAQSDATLALADAANAQTTADTAVTNAASAQTTADTAVTNAASAQTTADTASAAAAAAQGTADSAVTDAAAASSAAAAAQGTADSAVTDAAAAVITADLASVTAFSHFPTVSSFYNPASATPANWIADFVAGKVVIFQPTTTTALTNSFFSQTTNGLVFRLGNDNSVSSNHILTINDGSNDIVEIAPSEYITLFYNSYSSVANSWDKWIKFPGIINGVYPTAPAV